MISIIQWKPLERESISTFVGPISTDLPNSGPGTVSIIRVRQKNVDDDAHIYSPTSLRHMTNVEAVKHSTLALRGGLIAENSLHGDVIGVLLIALNADRVPTRTTCTQNGGVIRADDEVVPRGESQILRKRRGLVYVITANTS